LFKDRKGKIPAVMRTAALLPKKEQKKIDTRVAVVRRLRAAKKLLEGIPEEDAKGDVGLYFSRIQWLRRHDREEEAWTLMRATPNEPSLLLDLNEWWIERRINVRNALKAGHPEIAYEIASQHEPITGKYYAEAEFLAGWIALRFLKRPDDALKHFIALRTSALRPKVIARAEYWLGRASTVTGNKDEARSHFENATKYPLTYYGQLALQTLNLAPSPLALKKAPEPTKEETEAFLARDAVKAIGVIWAAGLEKLGPVFFNHLARTLESPGEAVLLAELAIALGHPHSSVRLGKIALNRGLPMAEYAYPIGLLPEYKTLNGSVDPALLHALSRQESEFNPKARSPVGARGIMQLMPRTARMVARRYKVRYQKSQLTRDPSYNVTLGVAFLSDLLDDYEGSYVLALCAYNAGGSRAKDWVEVAGDPRKPEIDAVDWVERIPFTETRNYVQKILTTMQIFRSRIEGPDNAIRLVEDLNRYKPVAVPAPDANPGPVEANATKQP
jgi:soluble lytic murein transglycosylase